MNTMKPLSLLLMLPCVTVVVGDIYLHNPRGSNDRLNEKSAARSNANRLFDSQNNNRGGYNVGDATDDAHKDEGSQYRMKYFMSAAGHANLGDGKGQTHLTIEWTNQHGCGGNEDSDPHKVNCNLVFQYMCQEDVSSPTGTEATKAYTMRNGVKTNTQDYQRPNKNENQNQANQRRKSKVRLDRGLQESYDWYDKCLVRDRNKGLFTADQILKDNNGLGYSGSIYTRQNPNGNRRGYECPEERDYYPYWHPTPWKDIAVLAENDTMCNHYKSKSFNVQPYHECVEHWDAAKKNRKPYSRWNNQAECEEHGGVWALLHNYLEKAPAYKNQGSCNRASSTSAKYIWAIPYDSEDGRTPRCLVALQEPECKEAPWTRSNHLGNGRDGQPNNYTWVLPYFPSGKTHRCVLRMRYNISTDDYDPYFTDASQNKDKAQGIKSPVQQNPYIEIGVGSSPLRLAINTAQFGRTFQDRTHLFQLRKRPQGTETARILNLNVRGKRGNIVQVYPAVEYDFFPTRLHMTETDMVHIQWTGSNSHNNGSPGGDGQTGDAGEGKSGTDRSNIVQIRDLNTNYPLPYEHTTMWKNAEVVWIHHGKTDVSPEDLALDMASAGFYRCITTKSCPAANMKNYIPGSKKETMNNQLNNVPASYEGALLKFRKGSYHYICSRNNNFTNRSQKGSIIVL